jgi:acetylornithine deacetylase
MAKPDRAGVSRGKDPGVTCVDLLAELIAFPTQQTGVDGKPGHERPICEHLARLLTTRGADQVVVGSAPRTEGGEGAYVFARWGTPHRVVNVHVDTVPANAGWSRDPWTAHVDGERIYGLGAADTKGAIAATLVALGAGRPRDVGVVFSGDEEAGSAVMAAFLATEYARAIRQVIVCEPTARVAGVAHRGVLAQLARLRGPGGHSSRADHLPKPIAQLARLAVALDEVALRRQGDGPADMRGTCTNIAALRGGVAFNVIPASAELEWSLRPYPGFDRATWDREVAELARGIDPAIELATTIDHAPFRCDALADFARPFVRAIGPLDFWTEAALWAEHGVEAIVIGPGDIAQAHAADEYVTRDDLDWAVALISAWLGA